MNGSSHMRARRHVRRRARSCRLELELLEHRVQPSAWVDANLSVLGGGPPADPDYAAFGYVTPDGPTARVVYTGVDGDIHELHLSPGQGWVDADLSVLGGGPHAASAPFGYVTPDGPTARVVYTGVDNDIHELHLSPGQGWMDADLSVLGGGPQAASAPSGYVTPDGPTARVVYTGADGDIHELHLSPGQGWIDADLSALGGGPHAISAPSGYVTPDGPTARVVYGGGGVGDVHELSLSPGQGWIDADLSALGGGTPAYSNPFGYVTPDGPTARVVYTGGFDVDVHELSLSPGQGWVDTNLSAVGGGTLATLAPSAYVTPDGPTARVVYTDFRLFDHIHELSLSPGQGWIDADLTQQTGGPQAVTTPFGYVTPDGPTARVVYIGGDGDVHELHLSPGPASSARPDLSILSSALPATGSPSAAVTPDSIPSALNNGNDRDSYDPRLESGSTTDSATHLSAAWTDVLPGPYPAQGLSWQPTILPLGGLDGVDELFAN